MKRLCARVDIVYSQDYKSSVIESDGGCYKDGEVGFYVQADPNKLYKFDYVPIEVRSKYDPYTVWAENNYELGEGNDLFLMIAYISVVLTIILALCAFCSF